MTRGSNARDRRAAPPGPAARGLSRTLAYALVGAALGGVPGAAPAEPQSAAPTVTDTAAPTEEQRPYGPLRPGLGTPANTMAPGQISVETGLADWERDDDDGTRSDTVLIGSTIVRIGLTSSIEALAGWTPFGHVRMRDASGAIDRADRVGDAMLGFKVNLHHPDGSGLSAAIQPFVTLPVGRRPVGAGDWGGGIVAPVSYDLSKAVNVAVTTEVDAATNNSGEGRHLSYSLVGGVSLAVTSAVKVTGELSARRDDDPDAHLSQRFAAVSIGWAARSDLQLDIGTVAGLNRNSPDFRIYAGVSRRF